MFQQLRKFVSRYFFPLDDLEMISVKSVFSFPKYVSAGGDKDLDNKPPLHHHWAIELMCILLKPFHSYRFDRAFNWQIHWQILPN